MTCIIGLEHKNKVFIAGDFLATDNNIKVSHTQPKVFIKQGIVIGYANSYRYGQIIENTMQDFLLPKNPSDTYSWLVRDLVPNIRSALSSHGCESVGSCLLGIGNQLWILESDFSVIRPESGFYAIGSGREYALGSLITGLSALKSKDTETLLTEAIAAASVFCPTVGRDSKIIST